jgi:hypothetical protein
MLTMHAAADACRPHLSWGYSLGWGRQKSRTTHACSCSRSMCVDSGRARWPLLSPARSLAPDEVDPFGSVWAPDRGRTATSNIYRFCSDAVRPVPPRPSVPCVLSVPRRQSVSQSVSRLQPQPRVLLSHAERTRGPPASGAAADTDRWLVLRYDTLRYEYLFFVLFWKNVVLFLVWKRDFWSLGMHRAIFFSSPHFGFPFLLRSSVQQSLWASIIHIYPELIWNDPTWSRCST